MVKPIIKTSITAMIKGIAVCGTLLLAASAALAQEKQGEAAAKPMPMQHEHHGFMQEGMHHAVAKGVKLDPNFDMATHTIMLRVGPMNLPAHTSHMKMPQPPDLIWTVPLDGWLRHFHVRGVRRQVHWADAKHDCMRGHVEIRIELDALRHRVVHALLHESVMLVLHRHRFRRRFTLFFLGEGCARGQQKRSANGDSFDHCCDARFDYWFDHGTSPGLPSPGRGLLSSYSPPENGVMQWGVLPNEQQPCSNVEEKKNRDAWCRASGLSMK